MRPDGSFAATDWGPISAIGSQPRSLYERELRARVPTRPWGSWRLPARLVAGGSRRTLFRSLLRRAEGVRVAFADGSTGTVSEVVFGPLGFDFWPEALIVETAGGKRRVPTAAVTRIEARRPQIEVAEPRDGCNA